MKESIIFESKTNYWINISLHIKLIFSNENKIIWMKLLKEMNIKSQQTL